MRAAHSNWKKEVRYYVYTCHNTFMLFTAKKRKSHLDSSPSPSLLFLILYVQCYIVFALYYFVVFVVSRFVSLSVKDMHAAKANTMFQLFQRAFCFAAHNSSSNGYRYECDICPLWRIKLIRECVMAIESLDRLWERRLNCFQLFFSPLLFHVVVVVVSFGKR